MSDDQKQRTCWQKKRFYSEERAKFSQKLMKKRYKQNMDVYKCPFCEFYHLSREKDKGVK